MDRVDKKGLIDLLNSKPILSKSEIKSLAAFLGISEQEINGITFEEVMDIRMIRRAFNDTKAWVEIKKRAYGPPISNMTSGPVKIKVILTER